MESVKQQDHEDLSDDSDLVQLDSENEPRPLTDTQKERLERNRQKALALRRSRIHHRQQQEEDALINENKKKKLSNEDSFGGFFFEEEDDVSLKEKRLVYDEPPAVGYELLECEECREKFAESFLWSHFKFSVCNKCRDLDGDHKLITKTEAKEKFLLKDIDFEDRGGPPLMYILKQNPHTSRGDMKLYLICQVADRSYQLWGGKEGLEEERDKRTQAKEKRKRKNYLKEVKELRKTVYAQHHSKSQSHTHVYSLESEQYDPDIDSWTKSCKECGHTVSFEKM